MDLKGESKYIGLAVPPFDYAQYADNAGPEWKNWVQSFEFCMKASGIEDENRKVAMLLHFAGRKVQEVYCRLPEPDIPKQGPWAGGYVYSPSAYGIALAKLNEFFLPKQNATYERHVLRLIRQEENETICEFAMRLKTQAERCDFGNQLEENVKDQVIEKCRSVKLRREMLRQGDASLDTVLKIAKVFESITKQEKVFMGMESAHTSATEINIITDKSQTRKREREGEECFRCGYSGHRANSQTCPALGKTCNKCGGRNHFRVKCKSQGRIQTKRFRNMNNGDEGLNVEKGSFKRFHPKRDVIKYVEGTTDEYVFCINSNHTGGLIKCKLGQVDIMGTIDSGSKFNLIGSRIWTELKAKNIEVMNQRKGNGKCFRAYGGFPLEIAGIFNAEITIGRKTEWADFYVMALEGDFLIGSDTAKKLGILKTGIDVNQINDDINENNQLIGKIKDVVVDIPLRQDIPPVAQPYRRIAVPLEQAVDKKIDELLRQGVIEKVNGSSRWISQMVVIPKDDGTDIRICIDMRRANEAIQRENYPLPTIDNFMPYIKDGKIFTKLDIKQAFHQVEISEKSREITTFMTRKGLFRYTRLMFGITCAPEIFQRIMDQMLSGCEGCFIYIDDVLIFGKNKDQLTKRVAKVTDIFEEKGVVLNCRKCIYNVSEIEFLGHRWSEKGITPTESKVSAVKNFRVPQTVEEVRSFLGLITYVGKFIPDLATITEPLRTLTVKSVSFNWETEHQEAFAKLKELISSDMVLGYYNINDKAQLFTDASPVGLGAVLMQYNEKGPRVISYASKSLTQVEKRYCQTEKEALALVWGVERFHYYLYGREFELITDHKPLEVIFGMKSKPCARIERWVLRLQSYRYNIIYKKGKNNIADSLSRLVTEVGEKSNFDEYAEHYVSWIAQSATPKALKMSTIIEESNNDQTILGVKNAISTASWPEELKQFKLFETELCFAGDILLRGSRIVMPEALRKQTIQLAHEGHPGMTVMKRRLRAKVWWPKIDKHAEEWIKNCKGCTLVSAPSAPEPMIRKKLPSEPWKCLAIDFLGPLPSGHNLLVIVDYYSRFIEIEIMQKIDTSETIKRLRAIFARFGAPQSITADNGRQLVSEEFKDFCSEFNIELISTIPYWPQQNGEVERQNRSILKRLVISQNTGRNWAVDLQDYLLMYRSTPHSTTLKTPAELLFGRNIRDKMPSIHQPVEVEEETRDRDAEQKEKGKDYGDNRRNAKIIDITEGDNVLIKRQFKMNKLSSTFEPTIYKVIKRKGSEVTIESTENNKRYCRNVAHLKKVNEDDLHADAYDQSVNISSDEMEAGYNEQEGNLLMSRRMIRRPNHLKDFV